MGSCMGSSVANGGTIQTAWMCKKTQITPHQAPFSLQNELIIDTNGPGLDVPLQSADWEWTHTSAPNDPDISNYSI